MQSVFHFSSLVFTIICRNSQEKVLKIKSERIYLHPMIDFYWLKSFTEIMQLFLSVLFIIYLKVKFDRTTPVILWLAVFFYIKLVTDVYGIINYTSWITDFISRPVLMTYLAAIGPSEIGMITSLLLFVRSTVDNSFQPRKSLLFFVPAVLSFPIICLLLYHFPSSLPVMFNVIKITWIASLI